MYRKLKNAQGTMHTFSVAVIVRKLIELFFFFVERKGFNWLVKTLKIGFKKIINILNKTKRLPKSKQKMVHMYGDDMLNEYITLVFSKNYTLLGIELAKKKILFKKDPKMIQINNTLQHN